MANLVKKFKDKKTLARLENGHKETFIKVYDAYVSEIYRFVYFKVGHREEANDLTSTIFLKTWNHIRTNSLESAKTLRALLYKIARNAIVDYYRDAGTKSAVTDSLDNEAYPLEVIDITQDPQADMDRAAELEVVKKKLPLLKDEYREVIIMKFINDLSLEEIAEISGKSRGNVRVLIHRALNALKALVEEEKVKL